MANVRAGGLTFWGDADAEGFTIADDGLKGWFKGVDVRRDEVRRPQAHGSFDQPGYLDSRVVSVSGLCLADSPERLNYYSDQLTSLLANGEAALVTVEMPWGVTWGSGRLASSPEFDVIVWGQIARYQIQFWCADPRKYGESRTVTPGTSVTALHYGNFPALPVLTVAGSMASGYTVNGPTGKLYTVTTPLVSGHPHTIDMRDGYLRVDGAVVVGGVTQADLWTVPPGATVPMSLTGTGSGTLSATTFDTYI